MHGDLDRAFLNLQLSTPNPQPAAALCEARLFPPKLMPPVTNAMAHVLAVLAKCDEGLRLQTERHRLTLRSCLLSKSTQLRSLQPARKCTCRCRRCFRKHAVCAHLLHWHTKSARLLRHLQDVVRIDRPGRKCIRSRCGSREARKTPVNTDDFSHRECTRSCSVGDTKALDARNGQHHYEALQRHPVIATGDDISPHDRRDKNFRGKSVDT